MHIFLTCRISYICTIYIEREREREKDTYIYTISFNLLLTYKNGILYIWSDEESLVFYSLNDIFIDFPSESNSDGIDTELMP